MDLELLYSNIFPEKYRESGEYDGEKSFTL